MSLTTRTLDRRMVRATEARAIPAPHQATVVAEDRGGRRRRLVVVAYTVSERGGEAHVLLPDGRTCPVTALEEVGLAYLGVRVDAEVTAPEPVMPLPVVAPAPGDLAEGLPVNDSAPEPVPAPAPEPAPEPLEQPAP